MNGFPIVSIVGLLIASGITTLFAFIKRIWTAGRAGRPAIPADSEQGLMRVMATPLWFRSAVVPTAGISDEIMFRSYPIERLLEMTSAARC